MLTSTIHTRGDATVLRLAGVLNSHTHQRVRDAVVKVAVDDATAVIVDVNDLEVLDPDSWTVFASATWCVQQWPEVPIALVSSDPVVHARLGRRLPVYETLGAARQAIGDHVYRYRHRARETFSPHPSSVNAALLFVHEHLLAWSLRDKVSVASTVATVFAENALTHACNGFGIRLEATDDEVVVAVSDASPVLAVRRERPLGSSPAGLDIISALCRRWGNTPTADGKTVWARIGPDDSSTRIGGRRR